MMQSSINLEFFVIPLALVVGGILALVLGRRGRRVDDHPICRRCGYDVFGVYPQTQVCPECGVDLTPARAVRVGKRQRFKPAMVAGGIMLGLGLVGLGVLGFAAAQHIDLNQYKPVWWLISDTRRADRNVRDAALREINNRYAAGKLSAANIVSLVDRALEVQGNPKEPWSTGWGDLVESAQNAGQISAVNWNKYLSQAVQTSFVVDIRPRVRKGAPLVVRQRSTPARVGSVDRMYSEHRIDQIEVDGQAIRQNLGSGGSGISAHGSGASWATISADEPAVAKLEPGMHELRAMMTVTVHYSWKGNAGGMFRSPPSSPAAVEKMEFKLPLEIVDGPTVKVVKDEDLRPAMEGALSATWRMEKNQPGNVDQVWVNVNSKGLPMSAAFHVFARVGQKEWELGSIALPKGESHGWGLGKAVPELKGQPFDLVLKPSVKVAEGQIWCTEIWDGEVIIKDVKERK